MTQKIEIVPFNGHDIVTIAGSEKILVPVTPLVESMGLDAKGQKQRIRRDPILSKGGCLIQSPSAGGLQETFCIELKYLPGFLMGIKADRIKDPLIRQRVILFQEEAYEALFAHFFGPIHAALNRNRLAHDALSPQYVDILNRLERVTVRLRRAITPGERNIYHAIATRYAEMIGLRVDSLDAFQPALAKTPDVDRFWDIVLPAIASGALTNWHRQHANGMIALIWRDVAKLCHSVGFKADIYDADFLTALRAHSGPTLTDRKNVNPRPDLSNRIMAARVFTDGPVTEQMPDMSEAP